MSRFPPSGNKGYLCNRDVPIQLVTFNVHRTDRRIGIPTKAPQELPLPALCSKPPVPPCLSTVGQGKHRDCRSLLFPKTHSVRLLDNTGKVYPFTGKELCGSHILPRRSYVEKYIWTNPVGLYYIWKYWGDSNLMRGGFSQRERHRLRLGANRGITHMGST